MALRLAAGLVLTQAPTVGLKLETECPLCKNGVMTGPMSNPDKVDAMLFGMYDAYCMCPSCNTETNDVLRKDVEFQRQVRVFLYTKYGRVLREKARLPAPYPKD